MKSGGSYLGVGVKEIDAERARALSLREEYGVEVTQIEPESPADKAGIRKGDVVLEYNGQRVEGIEQFVRLVRETPVGRNVKMTVHRAGSSLVVGATTAQRKSPAFHFSTDDLHPVPKIAPFPDMPRAFMSWRSSILGVEAESLESQLAEFFGVKQGVLVRSVLKDSAAEKAGLKAGDVITKVEDTRVGTPREVSSAIRSLKAAKKAIPVTIIRERREMTLTVNLEDDRSLWDFHLWTGNRQAI
jgi:serine protease Do